MVLLLASRYGAFIGSKYVRTCVAGIVIFIPLGCNLRPWFRRYFLIRGNCKSFSRRVITKEIFTKTKHIKSKKAKLYWLLKFNLNSYTVWKVFKVNYNVFIYLCLAEIEFFPAPRHNLLLVFFFFFTRDKINVTCVANVSVGFSGCFSRVI